MSAVLSHMVRRLSALAGWRRNAVAFICGIGATLALPPFFCIPLLIPAFCGLYILNQYAPSRRRAFFDGWWWGWGMHMTGLYWFCIALLTDAEKFAWLLPFALFGLTGVIALYPAVMCGIMYSSRTRGFARIVVFATLWTMVEYARGHLFTGFPWNLQGYSFSVSDLSLQLASVFGAYGLTWWAVFLALIPMLFFTSGKRSALTIVLVGYGLLCIGLCWGAWRLEAARQIPEGARAVEHVRLRLVQANIQQSHKWDPKLQRQGLEKHIYLTQLPGLEQVTHIIWPETAVPYVVKPDTPLVHMLGNAIPKGKFLISGALRAEGDGETWSVWNSLVIINHTGAIVGNYDKGKLVPFGEFLPFRAWLPSAWLTPVGEKDFSSGPGPETIQWQGLPPVSPLICYEAVFPELAVNKSAAKPGLLLNVTNDAWFGQSTGPHQHFEMARMRAVEQGVPLIRVANTGISAVIDAYGVVWHILSLGEEGVIDSELPSTPVNNTTFTLIGDQFLLLLIFISIVLTINQRKNRRN